MSGGKGLGQPKAVERHNISIELANKKVSKTFSMQNFGDRNGDDGATAGSINRAQLGRKSLESKTFVSEAPDSQQNLMTQSELFKQYSEQNHLMLNLTNNMYWFEFGGNKIGRLYVEGAE